MAHRILFTIPNFTTAGSGRALLNVAGRLDRSEFEPSVCVLNRGGTLEHECEARGIRVLEAPFTVPATPRRSLLSRVRTAARHFTHHEFDLWHSFHYLDDYTEPLIARAAGARHWVYTKKNMSWGGRAWHVRTFLASRVAVQNSDMMVRFFDRWPRAGKARPVPRGVDTERFAPAPPNGEVREALGVPSDRPLVGCVADLLPVKGQITLVEALAEQPEAHLILAGRLSDVAYVDRVKERIDTLGLGTRVHLPGRVDDVPALLSALDVFVLPSWARWRMEGCPVALLEAMAAGVPCVATAIPGSRDILSGEGAGVLVPPEDPLALSRALSELLSDSARRARLAEGGRRRVLDRYRIETEVAAHVELYRELLPA